MKKLLIAAASAVAMACTTFAGSWFDAKIGTDSAYTDWPETDTSVTIEGQGTWTNVVGTVYDTTEKVLKVETSGTSLTFAAAEAKNLYDGAVTIASDITFTQFDSVPTEIPEGAKGGVVVVGNETEGTNYYVLVAAGADANKWQKVEGVEVAAGSVKVSVKVGLAQDTQEIETGYQVTYTIGDATSLGTYDIYIADDVLLSETWVSSACFSGNGTVASLTATAEGAAGVTFTVADLDNATNTVEGATWDKDNSVWVAEDDETTVTVTYWALDGFLFKDGEKTYVAHDDVVEEGDEISSEEEVQASVAKIGAQEYLTLNEAFDAATADQTITLLANIETSTAQQWTITKNITLDFNGYTITKKVTNDWVFTIASGADVTFAGTAGGITFKPYANGSVGSPASMIQIFGKLTVEGGTYVSDYTIFKVDAESTARGQLVVNGGTMTIVDGRPAGKNAYALMNWGDATINGGTWTGDLWTLSYGDSSDYGMGVTEITTDLGATAAYKFYLYETTDDYLPKFKGVEAKDVTIGYADASMKDYLVTKAGDYVTVAKGKVKIGTTYYLTLKAAFDAATAGQTVTLVADIAEAVTNENTASFTLDLNGKTVSSDAACATIKQDAIGSTLTIVDSVGTGKVVNSVDALDMGQAIWARQGSIVVNAGYFENASTYEATVYVGAKTAKDCGSTITINGGTFVNKEAYRYASDRGTLNVWNQFTDTSAIKIYGGKFSTDPAKGDDSLGGTFLASHYWTKLNAETSLYEVKAMLKYYATVYADGQPYTWAGLGTGDAFYAEGVTVDALTAGVTNIGGQVYYVSKLLRKGDPSDLVCEFEYNGTTLTKKDGATLDVTINGDNTLSYKVTTGEPYTLDSLGHACIGGVYYTKYVAPAGPTPGAGSEVSVDPVPGYENTYTVEPTGDSKTVVIDNVKPEDTFVVNGEAVDVIGGVSAEQIVITNTIESGVDISAAFMATNVENGAVIVLNPAASVTVAGDTIPVTPEVKADAAKPIDPAASATTATVAGHTIPGLTYQLTRCDDLGAATPEFTAVGEAVKADSTSTTLTDPAKPATKAFYKIQVTK